MKIRDISLFSRGEVKNSEAIENSRKRDRITRKKKDKKMTKERKQRRKQMASGYYV